MNETDLVLAGADVRRGNRVGDNLRKIGRVLSVWYKKRGRIGRKDEGDQSGISRADVKVAGCPASLEKRKAAMFGSGV